MHLTCPSCGATFLVEPEQLGPSGRSVRCGECGHTWHQDRPSAAERAEESEAAAEVAPGEPGPGERASEIAPARPDAEPVPAEPGAERAPAARPPPEPAAERERIPRRAHSKTPSPPGKRRGSSLAAGWIAFFVVVAGLAAGFYFGQDRLVAMAPGTARLYALVGLTAEPLGAGLEIRDVKSVRRLVDGERVVVIEGLVANVSAKTRKVPSLRASLTDADGVELDRWSFSAASTTLPPGGTTGFETIARNPPREGSLSIDFVPAN